MKSFETIGIVPALVEGLQKTGIKEPTPIQEKAIPVIFKGRDIIAKAQTGTGKTLAFALPLLQRVHVDVYQEQVLMIAPTRELVKQIADDIRPLAQLIGVDVVALIGGQTIEGQLQKLGRRPHMIVGTPGRLLDHYRRGSLSLETIRAIVLDEADQMLHMGFLPDVESILQAVNSNHQLLLFSATIPDKIRALAKTYMTKAESVTVAGKHVTVDTVEQRVYMVKASEKTAELIKHIQKDNPYLAIVFCNTKDGAAKLSGELIGAGLSVCEIHGDMTQGRRTQVLKEFTKGRHQILVATDIAARGIDIEGISHVYNYDVTHDVDYYIHRIGRTGRAGHTGLAITFATEADEHWLRRIERNIQATITKYAPNGQVRIKGANRAEKKVKATKRAKPTSSYQATKKKVHKALGHKGSNNRRRRSR